MLTLSPSQRLLQTQFEDEKEALRKREALRRMLQGMNSGQMPTLPDNSADAYGDAFEKAFIGRRKAAEPMETPETKASDNMLSIRERLMGRNQRAQEGRVPGYMPELTDDDQQRVSDRLMRAARGGMVDETSPLNNRGAAYAAAAARDRSQEAQDAAEQQAMSKRFRSLMATRDKDAKVAETFDVGRSATGTPSRVVRTFAERIAGVEDDPTTPMDESIRYRAEWDFGKGSDEGKQAALEQLKEAGRVGARGRRDARIEKNTAIREKFQAQKAEESRQQQLSMMLRRMMGLDAATKGNSHATASFLGMLGQGMTPPTPNPTDDTERDRQVSVALALLDPASSDDDKAMGRSILEGLFGGGGGADSLQIPEPKLTEEKAASVSEIADAVEAGKMTKGVAASKEAESKLPAGSVQKELDRRQRQKQMEGLRWKMNPITPGF